MSEKLKNGSDWLRADFHLHTRADKEFKYDGAPNDFVKEYVAALQSAGIGIGVITNHNKFAEDEFKALRKQARKSGICLLPGVELSVGDGANGIHTLVVFSDEWLVGDAINGFLRVAFEGREPSEYENENGRSQLSLLEAMKRLEERQKDFFVVFAHVEQSSGLWTALNGGRLQELGRDPRFQRRVLGFQKVRTNEKREKVRGWLGAAYPAEVEGCDCKSVAQLSIPSAEATFLKVGAQTFDAVKYALSDFPNRLRSSAPKATHSHVRSIRFDGGRLAGETLNLSPGLNTVIGIRGSGKSSILEALRYALGLTPSQVADENYKTSLVTHTLASGGQVTLDVVNRKGVHYEVRRILREDPEVFVGDAVQQGVSICETVLHKPIYFGQKDLSQGGDGFEKQLIDKLVGSQLDGIRTQIREKSRELESVLHNAQTLDSTQEDLADAKSKLHDAEHRLKFYADHGVTEKMAKQTLFKSDAEVIEQNIKAYEVFLSDLGKLAQKHDSTLALVPAGSDLNNEFFKSFALVCSESRKVIDAIAPLGEQARQSLERMKEKRGEFAKLRDEQKEEFAKLERQLTEELGAAIKLEEFKEIQDAVTKCGSRIAELKTREQLQSTQQAEVLRLMSEQNGLWHKEFLAISKALEVINGSESPIRIEMEFKGDHESTANQLKSLLRGSGLRGPVIEKALNAHTDFGSIYKSLDSLVTTLGAQGALFLEKFKENLPSLLTWQPLNKFTIKYHGKELHEHSLGQRASAMILFILNQQDNDVIIIDQPEDDLDNQTIYEDVIKLVCSLKSNIQFILATHNPNFPVLGDAEQVVACKQQNGKIELATGSIDSPEQQATIVNIMEGGAEAFARRQQRYEAWKEAKPAS